MWNSIYSDDIKDLQIIHKGDIKIWVFLGILLSLSLNMGLFIIKKSFFGENQEKRTRLDLLISNGATQGESGE